RRTFLMAELRVRSHPGEIERTRRKHQNIPVYSLVTAGGPFRDNPDTRLLGRIHPPENLRSLNHDYLVDSRGTLDGTRHRFGELLPLAVLRARQQVREDGTGRRTKDSRVCLHLKT